MGKKAGILFLCLGMLLLLLTGGFLLKNRQADQSAGVQSREILQKIRVLQQTQPTSFPTTPSTPEASSTLTLEGNTYLGILSIPAIDLELPVLDSWSYEKLKAAPCRQAGSIAGEDLVICAHNYSTHFGKLHTLTPGTLLLLTDASGTVHTYILSHISTLPPEETDLVLNTSFSLVLYTCTPGGSNRVAAYCLREN